MPGVEGPPSQAVCDSQGFYEARVVEKGEAGQQADRDPLAFIGANRVCRGANLWMGLYQR